MSRTALLAAAALLASLPAFAGQGHAAGSSMAPGAGEHSRAEIRKVDKSAGKVTLKHGPIPNLEMPAMTMVFKVKDPAMLDKVKAGDQVRFKAENVNGAYTVVDLQPAK